MRQIRQRSLLYIIAIAAAMQLVSCGSSKKLAAANEKNTTLEAKNNQLTKQVADLTASNTALTNDLDRSKTDFDKYKKDCEVKAAKLKKAEAEMNEQLSRVKELETKIEVALKDFEDKGAWTEYQNGLFYVHLPDELMYKSGSSALGQEGKNALSTIAAILNDYPKLKIVVVGNTDTEESKKGSDGWSLSTERANGVVRVLRDSYKVDPARLTSAGRSKFSPVTDNNTEKGRSRNRRTDIVINPNIDRLLQLLEGE